LGKPPDDLSGIENAIKMNSLNKVRAKDRGLFAGDLKRIFVFH
jgi:hypothetical protein